MESLADGIANFAGFQLILGFLFGIYLAPSIVAVVRGHHRWPLIGFDVYPSDLISERQAKSSRNTERHQIGMVGDIILDSRATWPGISNQMVQSPGGMR